MEEKRSIRLLVALGVASVLACSQTDQSVTEVKHYPVEGLDGVISQGYVAVDQGVTTDGNGSLRIDAEGPTTVRLYETGDIDVEDARLTYQAKVRTEGVEGDVYLEMWCDFMGKGEYFSRDLQSPVGGTTEWSTEEAPFFLKKGENPDNVKLNLVINGKGRVWVDDIHLFKAPLK